jgi:hypothetical protein
MFGKSLIIPQEPHPFIPSPHAGRGILAQVKVKMGILREFRIKSMQGGEF